MCRKGKRINIPLLSTMYFVGDENEHKDADLCSEKSYLFFLTAYFPGIRLSGDRDLQLGKHSISGVFGALSTVRENSRERFIRTPGRTYNRIRSPRLTASSR